MAPLIALEDIHKIYQTDGEAVHALRGVSLAIVAGEFVALVGASGSGKSTLMNLLGCTEFQRLSREQGQTIILVTHDAGIAASARRIVTVCDGLIASDVLQ